MKGNKYLATVFSMVLALGTSAFSQTDHLKVGKTGELTLAQQTTVGNTVLPAGDYEIHYRHSAAGHYMEFSQVSGIIAVSGRVGGSGYEYRVIATVPCKVDPLMATVRQTSATILKNPAGTHLSALEIRGENVEHMF
jgi:hypothetical protein